jgi:uncharacterized protein (DUF58 family)
MVEGQAFSGPGGGDEADVSHVSRYLEPAVVEQLNHLQVSARSVVVGSAIGQHRSPIKGASIEFRQHRFYVPGDEPRRLDWRVLGRTDRPYVKEYDEETNLRCVLMLDGSGSMGYGAGAGSALRTASGLSTEPGVVRSAEATKYEYAARLAAALAYLMLGQAESVGVAICGKGVEHWLPAHAGSMQLARVLDTLEWKQPSGPSGLGKALHEVAERLERRALVIVLSDFFVSVDEVRSGLAHLRHDRHEVVAIQVVHRREEDFPFRNWCRLRGLEGEGSQLVEPAIARGVYQENFRRHRKSLQETCLGLQVEFEHLATDKAILEAVRAFLNRRG